MGADYDVVSSSESFEKEPTEEEQGKPLLKGGGNASDDIQIEVPAPGFGFNYGSRPYRDMGFAIAFLVFVTVSLSFGIFAAFNQNSDVYGVDSAIFDSQNGCVLPDAANGGSSKTMRASTHMRTLLSVDAQSGSASPVLMYVLYVLLATVIVSAPLAFLLLWLLRTYAKEFVYATLPFIVIIPLIANITWFAVCNSNEECKNSLSANIRCGIFFFVFALNVLFVWVIYSNRDRIELTIRIIRTASEALHKNLSLLLVLPTLNIVYCIYLFPAASFLFYAYTNGKMVINPEIVKNPEIACGGESGPRCCVWETDGWVPAYVTMATFVILWGVVLLSQISVFTISGTISQWYFATTGSSTVGTTKRSLSHAFGPSFGTLCFSGLIVSFVRMIRSAMESTRGEQGNIGIVALIVRACLQMILRLVEFLTEFTVHFAAITGQGFCQSAHMTFGLLKRNFLSTVVVETVAGRLLAQAVVVVAAVYGLAVWGALCLFVNDGKHLWGIALMGFVLLVLFLSYCTQILLHVVNTVYICYAMDKDFNEVSKPEVHDVYVLLPASKDDTREGTL